MIQVDLLRHGACQGGEIFRGATDVALSDEGWQQMHASVAQMPAGAWDAVFCSPLRRCREFAEQLAAERGLPLTVDDDWRELSFGSWEGSLRDEVMAQQAEAVRAFYMDPAGHPPPGGEAGDALQQRVLQAWQRVLSQASGQRVLVVTHGGVMRALLTGLLAMPLQQMFALDVPYACLTGLHHVERAGRTRLLFHSLATHSQAVGA